MRCLSRQGEYKPAHRVVVRRPEAPDSSSIVPTPSYSRRDKQCNGSGKRENQRSGSLLIGRRRTEDARRDRKSTRLNSSHANISYAVFCLKKKNTKSNLHS